MLSLVYPPLFLQGQRTLVVHAESADVIATLVQLKKEVEGITCTAMRLTIFGASEAHLLAAELAEAGVGVIIAPSRPLPKFWEMRRMYVDGVFFVSPYL